MWRQAAPPAAAATGRCTRASRCTSPHPCTPAPSAMKRTYATDFGMTFSFPLIARCAVGHTPHALATATAASLPLLPPTPLHPSTHETSSFQPRPVAHPPGSDTKSNDRPEASPILNVTFMRMSEDRSIHPPTFLHPLSPCLPQRMHPLMPPCSFASRGTGADSCAVTPPLTPPHPSPVTHEEVSPVSD